MSEHPLETLEVRAILDSDLERALAMDEEYVGVGAGRFMEWLKQRRDWFRGAYLGGELLGICFGSEREPGHVVLHSIAVEASSWRRGVGSRLIQDFEERVFEDGMERISLGSAADVPTESFYLKNGYRPTHILVRVDPDILATREHGLQVAPDQVLEDEEGRRLYFRVDRYRPQDRVTLRDACLASDAIYIFEKRRPAAV